MKKQLFALVIPLDDLTLERAAKGIHKMRGGASWTDLAPARKEAVRDSVRVVSAYLDRCLSDRPK